MATGLQGDDEATCLVLEDLTVGFECPCVLDVKMGVCTAAPDRTEEKRQVMQKILLRIPPPQTLHPKPTPQHLHHKPYTPSPTPSSQTPNPSPQTLHLKPNSR
jgi:hypothetical protein